MTIVIKPKLQLNHYGHLTEASDNYAEPSCYLTSRS